MLGCLRKAKLEKLEKEEAERLLGPHPSRHI